MRISLMIWSSEIPKLCRRRAAGREPIRGCWRPPQGWEWQGLRDRTASETNVAGGGAGGPWPHAVVIAIPKLILTISYKHIVLLNISYIFTTSTRYVCVCIHISLSIYIYIHIHIHIHLSLSLSLSLCLSLYIYMYTYSHAYMSMYVNYNISLSLSLYIYIYTYAHTYRHDIWLPRGLPSSECRGASNGLSGKRGSAMSIA